MTGTVEPEVDKETGGESLLTVLVALCANVLIAIAKSVVAVITGSASMVAEQLHDLSDAIKGQDMIEDAIITLSRPNHRPSTSRPPAEALKAPNHAFGRQKNRTRPWSGRGAIIGAIHGHPRPR